MLCFLSEDCGVVFIAWKAIHNTLINL